MNWGTSFSYRHAKGIGLDPLLALSEILTLPFSIIRLATYWEEIESKCNEYDFSQLDEQLKRCSEAKKDVVLTIGMKGLQWPEYYIPSWSSHNKLVVNPSPLLAFIVKLIEHVRSYSCITHWQVENEPLDPSGPESQVVPFTLLEKEVALIRTLDSRPILLTLWGNELSKRGHLNNLLPLSDCVGIDLYYKVPVFPLLYVGPRDNESSIQSLMSGMSKPFWITELQAEPWESVSIYERPTDSYRSFSVKQLYDNVEHAKSLNPQVILLWGADFWLYRKNQGDDSYWNAAKNITSLK